MTRHLPAAATYAIAVLAFALSYSNLAALAGRAGYGPVMAHVWPLVVDGLAVVATAAVMRLRASRVYAWSLLAAATAVSIVAGAAAHLLPAGPLPGGRARPSQSSRRYACSSRRTSQCSFVATQPMRRRRTSSSSRP